MDNRDDYMMQWLTKEFVPFNVLDLLYGIQKEDELLWGGYVAWSVRNKRQRLPIDSENINRYAFETFLQQMQLLPKSIAAAHIGMSESSFEKLITAIEDRNGPFLNNEKFSDQVVPVSLIRSLREYIPALRHRIFGDHNGYCRFLHDAIKGDFNLEVEPLFCITSKTLAEKPSDYAYEFDCFTGDPIGIRYQVSLDFRKPMYLKPDACSLKYFVENEDVLKHFLLLSRKPEIPDGLKKASSL